MANSERISKNKSAEADGKQHKKQPEAKPAVNELNPRENETLLTETPFRPRIQEHAEVLSRIPFSIKRQEFIMRLNKTYGNRYVQRLMQVQAKLTVSNPGDASELEADRVAEEVTRSIQRQEENEPVQGKMLRRQPEEDEIQAKTELQREDEEEEEQAKGILQRDADKDEDIFTSATQVQRQEDGGFELPAELENRITAGDGSSSPLAGELRAEMEPRFNSDFSNVRVHTDSEAEQLNRGLSAQAFTCGEDIYFGSGKYDPSTDSGKKLLAHELTHVVQQTGRRPQVNMWGSAEKYSYPNLFARSQEQATNLKSDNYTIQRTPSDEQLAQLGITAIQFAALKDATKARIEFMLLTNDVNKARQVAQQALAALPNAPVAPQAPALVAPIAPKGGASDAQVGNVKFYVTNFTNAATGNLTIDEDDEGPLIHSAPVEFKGTVKATGPAQEVSQWDVGFLQTVRYAKTYFRWDSKSRTTRLTAMSQIPVRDGDGTITPWYEKSDIYAFAEADSDMQTVRLWDQPQRPSVWVDPKRGEPSEPETLKATEGHSKFTTWLTVRKRGIPAVYTYLRNVDWVVNWGVNFDCGQAVGSRGAATGNTTVNAEGKGQGAITPRLGDPVANDAREITWGRW